ncbi:MAG TPA: BON domain-containing protein [Bryobacteraceae bacterium]|nr:BON domain-containing protein [Bryobacteraceae bacterium]
MPKLAAQGSLSAWIPQVSHRSPSLCASCLGVFVLCFSAAALAATAPSAKPVATKASPSAPTSAANDKQIEAAIKAKLAKSKIGADKLQVHVQGGVATWEGKTNVLQHKGAATRMAKTAGARSVVNNIEVSDEAKAKAAGNLEQGRRRVQVTRSDKRDERTTAQ